MKSTYVITFHFWNSLFFNKLHWTALLSLVRSRLVCMLDSQERRSAISPRRKVSASFRSSSNSGGAQQRLNDLSQRRTVVAPVCCTLITLFICVNSQLLCSKVPLSSSFSMREKERPLAFRHKFQSDSAAALKADLLLLLLL